MPFGAQLDGETVAYRLWAPAAQRIELVLGHPRASAPIVMDRREGGWYEHVASREVAGARYAFRVDGRLTVPDPASRSNPDGVHAASEVVDPAAYEWNDAHWRGRPWFDAVVYELHVGTFTHGGKFTDVITGLDALVELGVTALELMPVAAFPGERNWGYDGVLPFAPAAAYGAPDEMKALIDAAHGRGLMVLLDVVYNHFGPDGNYLSAYAPQFFTARHRTPWGDAMNFDGERSRTVREFFIHNALYWLHEYHLDGLRLDAVHAIADDSHPDFVTELARRVRTSVGDARQVHLVLENDRNEARYLCRDGGGAAVLATAQWNDDLHHPLHVIATGETDGYYADYADAPVADFARALAQGFVFQGQPSPHRSGALRGEVSTALPPAAFVSFAQNHDQIGNRALGERLAMLAEPDLLHALVACVLLAPQTPMLFMGEEFGAITPFLFFCDFGAELARAVTQGRRGEFKHFARFFDTAAQESIPDPNELATFIASKLDWEAAERPPGLAWRGFIRRCLAARREHVAPLLPLITHAGAASVRGDAVIAVEWATSDGRCLHLLANLGAGLSDELPLPQGVIAFATPQLLEPGTSAALPRNGVICIVSG